MNIYHLPTQPLGMTLHSSPMVREEKIDSKILISVASARERRRAAPDPGLGRQGREGCQSNEEAISGSDL